MVKLFNVLLLLLAGSLAAFSQKSYEVKSPDSKIGVKIEVGKEKVTYSVNHESTVVLSPSPISMTLSTGEVLGGNPTLKKVASASYSGVIATPIYRKKEIVDRYNGLTLTFKNGYSLQFRAYNDGVAYRFVTAKKGDINVVSEEASFCFNKDHAAFIPYVRARKDGFGNEIEKQCYTSFESYYDNIPLSAVDSKKLMITPVLVSLEDGKKMVITESNLEDYPGMFLKGENGATKLSGTFATYPKSEIQGGHNNLQYIVKEHEGYIAKTKGTRSFPWRVIAISTSDAQLADNDLVYKLADPSRVPDASWVKPGKVAWDWWNDWNISGVDFSSGVNNQTYKYYIDFAAANNIEYVILDEGWAVNGKADLFDVIPDINLQELVDYGRTKNVGIILWAGYAAIDKDMEKVCKHYADMGVKGFKVDFMDRDDQKVVNFYYRLAEVAARYKLMIDYHGAYKPTGLQRTYPNVINFEGVAGLEQMKWMPTTTDQVKYDVTIPFIRMVAGPMDYTQGAMRNAIKANYQPIYTEPMSQGTRCHQLALYVVFESPFNMLCDTPTSYMREAECTKFIAKVPTVWDRTVALDGKVGEYVATARQKDGIWYVGAITNWDQRNITLDLSFLGDGDYIVEVLRDGVNADKIASDYKKEVIAVPANRKLDIKMASGGGFVGVIRKR
jgi:Glycoside hydrolase 97.